MLSQRPPEKQFDDVQPTRRRLGWFRRPDFQSAREATRFGFFALLGASALVGILAALVLLYAVHLPEMDELARYHPSTTTELYDVNGKVFGSFALEHRVVVPYSEFPPVLRQAIFSIEDKDFETNGGLNMIRMVGAAVHDVRSKGKSQGASTLTMQLARNLFLSSEKTYGRKLQEIMLTLQIERRFTKQQIFSLYANQIYLGRGTYGFEAGSEYYFSKHARDLSLAEAATLAGLPKGPEEYSPVRHPERALRRRNLVLEEMLQDGKITAPEAQQAKSQPLGLTLEQQAPTEAPYFVEEVRRQLEREYGTDEAHGGGLRVYTTLNLDLERVANQAMLDGLAAYERRHGWKNKLPHVPQGTDLATYTHPDWVLQPSPGSYFHALVMAVAAAKMTVRIGQQSAVMTPPDWAWTQHYKASDLAAVGDIVYVKVVNEAGEPLRLALQQDSGAQSSLMAMDNANGEVIAMVGGRDYYLSQFNRATQALRQVGSSFKPYVYTTAIENGMKPGDIVLDVPTSFYTPSGPYSPHNYEANYLGAMTLTNAFAESRNIPALRLANKFGIKAVIETARRFGVTSPLPNFLPVAIGAADITLTEQVASFSVFPNDGIRLAPHYIRRVVAADGSPMQDTATKVREVTSVQTARTMLTLFQAVVQHGTAAVASSLGRALGGKTGTTNNYTDAWFIGFSPSITCGTWVGYDTRESLGEKETGARAALPIWMEFMKAALAGKPNESFAKANAPKKTISVPVEEDNGAAADDKDDPDMPANTVKSGTETAAPAAPAADAPEDAPATPVTPVPAQPLTGVPAETPRGPRAGAAQSTKPSAPAKPSSAPAAKPNSSPVKPSSAPTTKPQP